MSALVDAPPTLSVLVPTHNYAGSIVEAVRSVLEQAVDGIEIIVADDGSSDDTAAVLQPYVNSAAVRYFRQENAGPATARNLAMAQARGRYFMFLDADDVLLPGCVQRTLDFLNRHPDVGLFFTNYDIFNAQGIVSESGVDDWEIFRDIPHEVVGPREWLFSQSLTPYIIRHGGFMHTSGLTVSREVVARVGLCRDGFSYAEDDEFYARVAHATRAGYIDERYSRKRNHDLSITHNPANALRNLTHLLQLTEIQIEHYAGDDALTAILKKKLRLCSATLCWGLIEKGEMGRARSLLLRSIRRDTAHWPYWRLLFKLLLS